jgi:glyoxylase-like metal-dependent hydrolase (beta-lactamase superfamily II)
MQILDSLHQIDGVTAGVFLLIGDDGLTLVDAGVPKAAPKILNYIQALGYRATDVKHILLTHADVDHVGSLAALVQASGAQTYAHLYEAAVMAGRELPRGIKGPLGFVFRLLSQFFKPQLAQVDHAVQTGDELPLHNGIVVIGSPGHTRGHVCYYWRKHRVLFVGDALLHGKQLKLSTPMFTWDMAQAQASAQQLAVFDVEILCFGHGKPIIGDARTKLREFAATL